MKAKAAESRDRLSDVFLDEDTIPRGAIDIDHERTVAIFDLVEENVSEFPGATTALHLTIAQAGIRSSFRRARPRTASKPSSIRRLDDPVPARS